jgi:hypothetical protein
MKIRGAGRLCAALALSVCVNIAAAAGVSVRFDLASPSTSPFPSDRFTVPDFTQRTFRRVKLPKPDCAVRVSDCADIDVLNTLDGFNTQPRITVPFTGDIDVTTVNSDSVYLVNLGDTLTLRGFGDRVGINQILWDPATKTLVFESDELLAEHSRYLLVVTNGVRDAAGHPIEGGTFSRFRHDLNFGQARDPEEKDYRKLLMDGQHSAHAPRDRIVALSLFTTRTTTGTLETIRKQIKASDPKPVNFMIGNEGTRAVFPLSSVARIDFSRQVKVSDPGKFATQALPIAALVIPGSVGALAFGMYRSPDYQTAQKYIPAVGTLFGQPKPQGTNDLVFEIFVPAGNKPAQGWPVAIFGHGFTDSMYGAPWAVASVLASQGIATIAINVVGHGGGVLGTLNVVRTDGGSVEVPAGGRGIDQDGNGNIDSTEGVNAAPPRTIVGSSDSLRQTTIDLMQLVRQIEGGIDIDGDNSVDLDANRIYYSGQSFGGIYGTIFLGTEPNIKAGVPNVPGGSITDVARLGGFRPLTGLALATRIPSLINTLDPGDIPFNNVIPFNENIPLRDLPPVTNTVPGAMAIQQVLDANEWVQQHGNPVSYAPYIRKHPMAGNARKPVLIQFAKGDQTVPNPTTTAIIRAGDLADRAVYFRNDLAIGANAAIQKNPHTFLTRIAEQTGTPPAASFALQAQKQIATFFATNGVTVIDPDDLLPFFEVPIVPPLPEGLNYIF